jgi:hypothetical protein
MTYREWKLKRERKGDDSDIMRASGLAMGTVAKAGKGLPVGWSCAVAICRTVQKIDPGFVFDAADLGRMCEGESVASIEGTIPQLEKGGEVAR